MPDVESEFGVDLHQDHHEALVEGDGVGGAGAGAGVPRRVLERDAAAARGLDVIALRTDATRLET